MYDIISRFDHRTIETAKLRELALEYFRSHLLDLDGMRPEAAGLGSDDRLWIEEVFLCRAAQEGLGASVRGGSACLHIENFLAGNKLDAAVHYLDWTQQRHVAAIRKMAVNDGPPDEATETATILERELIICQHLATIAGRLRFVISTGAEKTFPAEPMLLAEFLCSPLSEVVAAQAEVRGAWTGKSGLGDCWGRAHGTTLVDTAKYSQTIGGKIDASLVASPVDNHGKWLQSRRLRMAMMTASELAEEFILDSPKICRRSAGATSEGDAQPWSDKSRQQFRSAARLGTKFMGVVPFVQATHADFVRLYHLLLQLPANHHINLADDQRTLEELVERACAEDTDAPRLKPTTARRHLSNLRTLRAWVSTGFLLPMINWEDLISFRGRGREVQDLLSVQEVARIFELPIWTGAAHYRGTPRPGTEIWHGASYWIPLLQWYSGIARDAVCALRLCNVTLLGDLWCLQVTVGQGGVCEDRGFGRFVPLHPEILRLGFLEFVEALTSEGEELLFPDLVRASGQLAADVFSSRYWRPARAALAWLPNDTGVGAIRLAAERALEDLGVPEDKSRDLFGLRGQGEIDLRYSKVTPPEHLMKLIEKIPNITSSLKASPIKLLPDKARQSSRARTVPRAQQRIDQEVALSGLLTSKPKSLLD